MADQGVVDDINRGGISPLQRLNAVSLHGHMPRECVGSTETPEGSRINQTSEDVEDDFVGLSGPGFPPKPKRGSAPGKHSQGMDWGDFRIPKVPRPSLEGFSEGESSSEDSGLLEHVSFRPSASGKRPRSRGEDVSHIPKSRVRLSDSSIFYPFAVKQVDNLSSAENEFLEKYVADPVWNPQLLEEILTLSLLLPWFLML